MVNVEMYITDGCKYSIVKKTHAPFRFKNECIVTVYVISSHVCLFSKLEDWRKSALFYNNIRTQRI
jgi:hypothetical protein